MQFMEKKIAVKHNVIVNNLFNYFISKSRYRTDQNSIPFMCIGLLNIISSNFINTECTLDSKKQGSNMLACLT